MSVAMQPLSRPTQARLSALVFAFAWVGVDAQGSVGGASSSTSFTLFEELSWVLTDVDQSVMAQSQ